jgi:magnesium transporter
MLINCVAYRQGQRLSDISLDELQTQVAQPDSFVWVALRDPSDEELARMQRGFNLHELAVEDARHGQQQPKVEEYGDTLFAVMNTIELDATDGLRIGQVSVFAGPGFVLSLRTGSQQDLLGVRERAEREPHLLRQGPGFVLYAVMDAVVDRYFPIVESMDDELEAIESQIFEPGMARANIERLYLLKQRITTVRHAVSPLLESVAKLASERAPGVCMHSRAYFRDVNDHLERIQRALDTLRESIGTAIQVNLSMVAIEESEVTKRLAAWAGIFGAATAFAGIWGMNFDRMPELHWRWGYPVALAIIGSTCAVLYWRFRRAGWL